MGLITKVHSVTLASAATSTGVATLTAGYKQLYVEVPDFSTNTTSYINVSSDGTTFRKILQNKTGFPATTADRVEITASSEDSFVEIPAGFGYYKLETQAAVANGATIKFIAVHEA